MKIISIDWGAAKDFFLSALPHLYVIFALWLALQYVAEDAAFHRGMFDVELHQAQAIVQMAQGMTKQ